MRITSKARRFISMLMKHLKLVISIPFKLLVTFYILMETIFLGWETKISKILVEFHIFRTKIEDDESSLSCIAVTPQKS